MENLPPLTVSLPFLAAAFVMAASPILTRRVADLTAIFYNGGRAGNVHSHFQRGLEPTPCILVRRMAPGKGSGNRNLFRY